MRTLLLRGDDAALGAPVAPLTRAQISTLPAVVDVATAAQVLGLSRTSVYERIRNGDWPTPVFRLGKLIRIPTAPLLELLGIEATGTNAAAPTP